MRTKKIFKTIGLIAGLALLLTAYFYFNFPATAKPVWGINFSPDQARYLRLDPTEVFQNILADLKPKKIRLVAYWENIEKQPGQFDFSETDRYLNMAQQAGTKITLVVGRKQPRWPECHQPEWVNGLDSGQQRQALLKFVEAAVGHFKNSPAIERWQVENEAFFNYGKDCPVTDSKNLQEEINLVRSLDNRQIVLTDSGEKGGWFKAANLSDVFGATMYRTVHNPRWGGYVTYPLPPAWYRVRAGMLLAFTHVQKIIGVELQAEPWFDRYFFDIPLDRQMQLMSVDGLEKNINYARRTGLPEHLFWGAEWWYYLKSQNHPEYWELIKATLQE